MALINQEYENYIYDYLTLTFSSFALQRSVKNNHIIWLSIFRSVVDEYFRNVRFVMSRPNNKPVRKRIMHVLKEYADGASVKRNATGIWGKMLKCIISDTNRLRIP